MTNYYECSIVLQGKINVISDAVKSLGWELDGNCAKNFFGQTKYASYVINQIDEAAYQLKKIEGITVIRRKVGLVMYDVL